MKNAVNAGECLNLPADRCIDETIDSGWRGINAEWIGNKLNRRPVINKTKDFSEGDDGFK
ncbi:MAG: hypothetical protein PF444_10265 [Bacteroidales bacterium]|jgi:hypothetical protein|nr:hypothetical protein [Bacteroidales bacterium]